MFFDFFKKNKTKTLLFAAGFLVLAGLFWLAFWFYAAFLVSCDSFFSAAPAESAIYWHSSFGEGADDIWLRALSEKMLPSQAAGEAEFLFQNVTPDTSETAFAVLPGFEDFIFWGKVDAGKFTELKDKLEKENLSYILEDDGRIAITNTKFALKEILAVLNQKSDSLADDKVRLVAWNRAGRRFASQIYFKDNFKFGDFDAMSWQSDFWSVNSLSVSLGPAKSQPQSLFDFDWFAKTDNRYLFKNAEKIIKDDLAVILPELKERLLPDNTVVREMMANPALFSFEKQTISGREINHLSVSKIGQEFFVGRVGEDVLISNSGRPTVDYLANLKPRIDYYGKNLVDLFSDWLKWVTPDFEGVIWGVSARVQ